MAKQLNFFKALLSLFFALFLNNAVAFSECNPLGEQKSLVLAVNFIDNIAEPVSIDTIRSKYFGTEYSLAGYVNEASYGRATLSGDALGWFTLNFKSSLSCDQIMEIKQAALEAAAPYVDLTQYSRVFIVMVDPPSSCGWAGSGEIRCKDINTSDGPMRATTVWLAGTGWFHPENYSNETQFQYAGISINAHELGHNFGFGHSFGRDYGAEAIGPLGGYAKGEWGCYCVNPSTYSYYFDHYDSQGGSVGHYHALHKYRIGWLQAQDISETNPSTFESNSDGETFRIQTMSSPLTGIKALRILRGMDPVSLENEYLWIESRSASGYDTNLNNEYKVQLEGAVVHHENTGTRTSNGTDLIDLTPQSQPVFPLRDFFDGTLRKHGRFYDKYGDFSLYLRDILSNGDLSLSVVKGKKLQVLNNASFEHGSKVPDNWAKKKLSRYDSRVNKKAHSGNFSFKMKGLSAKASLFQTLNLEGKAGEGFTLEASSAAIIKKGTRGLYQVEAKINYTDSKTKTFKLIFPKSAKGWITKQKIFSAEKDFNKVTIYLRFSHPASTAWFDDLRLDAL